MRIQAYRTGRNQGPGYLQNRGVYQGNLPVSAVDGLTGFTGAHLDDILRREYHLEMEMCGADYVTAITTVMDSGEGLERLGGCIDQD